MPKDFDAITRGLLQSHPADWLAMMGLGLDLDVRVIDSNLSTITAEADKVLRIEADQPWLVHVEIQSSYDPSLARRLLRYNALLDIRHDLPVHSVAVLLFPDADGPAMDGSLRRRSPAGSCSLEFHYQVVRVWEQPVDELASGWGTAPLVAAAARSEADLAAVIARLQRAFDAYPVPDERELWAALYFLIGTRLGPDVAKELFRGVRSMRESSTYQAVLAEGRAEGMEKGRAEGRVEGRVEGCVEGERRLLLRLGAQRLGVPSEPQRRRIEDITDPDTLERLADRVLHASDWDDLMKGLA